MIGWGSCTKPVLRRNEQDLTLIAEEYDDKTISAQTAN